MTTSKEQANLMGWLARMIDAKVIVEAGTYQGATANILADLNPTATVYTADPNRVNPQTLRSNVVYHHGDFLEMLLALDITEVCFAYIDATPPGDRVTAPYYRYEAGLQVIDLLRPKGIVCWDDTAPDGGWDGLMEIRDLAHFNLDAQKGLSIYQA